MSKNFFHVFPNLLLFLLLLHLSHGEISPIVPLTNAQTAIYCHNQDEIGMMTIRCASNEKIRMLDAFDMVVKNKSNLPSICSTGKHQSKNDYQNSFNHADCKVPTSFTSACSGRENCTVHMQRIRLNNDQHQCHNELVDYTIAFYECISDAFIYDICSTQSITSNWGTLQTPNFPNPYTSNDDCWCKLSTQTQHRLFLSVIVFQLIPYDQRCAGAGLYLHSSDDKRSTQCTYLQQGFSYLTDTNTLYMNFYSRISTVRGGFWIIYEANHANAEVHLKCGTREKIGVPSSSSPFLSSPSQLHSFNKGWNRPGLINPTRKMISSTSPSSRLLSHSNAKQNYSSMDGAFTYPYGNLATFELAYGPNGWFLKFPTDMTTVPTVVTTIEPPVIKWNSTWRYVRRLPTRRFTTRLTPKVTKTAVTTPKSSIVNERILIQHQSVPTTSETINVTTTTPSSQKSTLPPPTPWYPPAGPFDWWQWQWYATKFKKVSLKILTTTESSISTTNPSTTTTSTTTDTTTTTTVTTTTTSTTTLTTTTTMSTTTTTTATTTSTTTTTATVTSLLINVTNTSMKTEATADWFKWPVTVPVSVDQTRLEDFDDYYQDSTDSSRTSRMPIREQNIPGVNYLLTKPYRPFIGGRILTGYSDPVQSFSTLKNDVTTSIDMQNIIDRVINQKVKKTTDETEVLSQTDMTIVIVSILFIVLLAIVNLILFAVRRHRHRLRSRHLLSSSFPSLSSDRRPPVSNSHQSMCDSTNHLIDPMANNNNNNNDILPAVGEIVLWDEKDQGGYMIDNDGEWAKVEGHQWFRRHVRKTGLKASFSKSFRSRFRLTRHLDKKLHTRRKISEPIPAVQPISKLARVNDPVALSPVPENDDCPTSMISRNSFKDKIRLSLKKSEEKPCDDESNYATMAAAEQGEYSMVDVETDRSLANDLHAGGSVVVRVPTLFRRDDDTGTITDAGESIYNQNYTTPSVNEKTLIPITTTTDSSIAKFVSHALKPSIIVGHCQAKFAPLDPKLLMKPMKKSLTFDQNEFEHCSQSFHVSSYDSGFVDDSNVESIATTSTGIVCPESEMNFIAEKHRSSKRHVSFQGLDNSLKKPESLSNLFENYDQTASSIGTTSSSAFSPLQKVPQPQLQSTIDKETPLTDEMKKRQILMNQVLDSLKKKKVYFQSNADTSKPIEPSSSFIIPPPQAYQSPAARRYSRRFRSSSASSNNTGNSTDHSIIEIYPTNQRQSYNTTQHLLQTPLNSTDGLNHQVSTTTSNKQNLPLTELYTYPHSEHSIAETRF